MTSTDDKPTVRAQLDTLAAFPQQLLGRLRGLSDEQLRFRPTANDWSIVEIVGHLVDIDVLMRTRVGKIIAAENATLEAFDNDEAMRRGNYQHKQALALAHAFAEHRAAFVEELRYLRPAALARTGAHPTRGPISIADIIATLVRHDPGHAQQISDVLAARH
jgi:hypothetical protein